MNTTDRQATADEFGGQCCAAASTGLAAGTPTSTPQAEPDALPSPASRRPNRGGGRPTWFQLQLRRSSSSHSSAFRGRTTAESNSRRATDRRRQLPTLTRRRRKAPHRRASTLSTIPVAVRGNPICGAELPGHHRPANSYERAEPGPAVYGPTALGQFAQHWELPAGTIEVRWPADPASCRLETPRVRGNPTVFDGMTVAVPEDGSQAIIDVPEPRRSAADDTTDPAAADRSAPRRCAAGSVHRP